MRVTVTQGPQAGQVLDMGTQQAINAIADGWAEAEDGGHPALARLPQRPAGEPAERSEAASAHGQIEAPVAPEGDSAAALVPIEETVHEPDPDSLTSHRTGRRR